MKQREETQARGEKKIRNKEDRDVLSREERVGTRSKEEEKREKCKGVEKWMGGKKGVRGRSERRETCKSGGEETGRRKREEEGHVGVRSWRDVRRKKERMQTCKSGEEKERRWCFGVTVPLPNTWKYPSLPQALLRAARLPSV